MAMLRVFVPFVGGQPLIAPDVGSRMAASPTLEDATRMVAGFDNAQVFEYTLAPDQVPAYKNGKLVSVSMVQAPVVVHDIGMCSI